MAVTDWSANAASNTTIDGTNIAEGCSPGGMNNAIRSVMASVRVMYDNLPTVSGFMPLSGGTFTGPQPKYASEGAFLHHAASALSSGKVHILTEGAADPSGLANGDLIFYVAP